MYASGNRIPTQDPKQKCWILKLKGDDLARKPLSEARGGVPSRKMLQRRSASDLVIRPLWAADIGIIFADLSLNE